LKPTKALPMSHLYPLW